MQSSPSFYSGTSNIVLPFKQSEYPPEFQGASRLTYYASLFSSLEVNSSFYKIPRPATVGNWRESVPHYFKFTFKVPKTVTHAKGLQFNVEELERFTETVAQAGDKKGCLLIQLPPSVKSDKQEEIEGILECLRSDAKGWRIAVEFRDNSWYNSAVYRMLQNFGAGMVEQDMPKSATPPITVAEDFVYLRFHGPEGDYRGSYDDAFLLSRAKRIAAWLKEGKEVYVYFNNTAGDAFENLRTLNAMVAQRTAGKK
ncbi:DUF72 domain-containing protein [Flavisolibacter ginsenosidimutans]|uniref:DUF72 domain-containing protein n=1 Tax=Flavisolibacter ginsenosidimutans TaxID=661481 RepID=A0A5B8UF08_9BACT|nr:DUF72 domain-containing protein [Flavisolibacter ginsenosidimutans]QEC54719.1 DUF72 domain-containing protein [Flavisolibacter ginsenosidimutans]